MAKKIKVKMSREQAVFVLAIIREKVYYVLSPDDSDSQYKKDIVNLLVPLSSQIERKLEK